MRQVVGEPLILTDGRSIPISPAIVANNFVYTSGQLGVDDIGSVVPGGIVEQTTRALLNLDSVLRLAGSSLQNVVKASVWLSSVSDFREFNRIYAQHFPSGPPARSTVVSSLILPGALVEIDAIAVLE